jgi:hypothetical protein
MESLKITQQHIDLFQKPRDCFFLYNFSTCWCPGWAIGQLELPIVSSYSRFLTLVRDAEGGAHWVPANKVAVRGQNRQNHLLDISQKEMVERSLLNYNGILPEKT